MNAMTNISAVNVRLANEPEAGIVFQLFIENLAGIAHFKPDVEMVAREIYAAVVSKRVFVAERDGELIGCAAFALLRPWYLSTEQMWDQGLFVVPEHRKGRAAYLLKKALEDEAERLNVPLIISANTQNTEVAPILAKRHRKISDVFVVRE